jgi:hypothetical protein
MKMAGLRQLLRVEEIKYDRGAGESPGHAEGGIEFVAAERVERTAENDDVGLLIQNPGIANKIALQYPRVRLFFGAGRGGGGFHRFQTDVARGGNADSLQMIEKIRPAAAGVKNRAVREIAASRQSRESCRLCFRAGPQERAESALVAFGGANVWFQIGRRGHARIVTPAKFSATGSSAPTPSQCADAIFITRIGIARRR